MKRAGPGRRSLGPGPLPWGARARRKVVERESPGRPRSRFAFHHLPPPVCIHPVLAVHSFGQAPGVNHGVEGGAFAGGPVQKIIACLPSGARERRGGSAMTWLDADAEKALVRIRDLAGRARGTGFLADHSGTVVTSHEAVDGLTRMVLEPLAHSASGGASGGTFGGSVADAVVGGAEPARLVSADAVTPLPELDLALVRSDGFGFPLVVAASGRGGPPRCGYPGAAPGWQWAGRLGRRRVPGGHVHGDGALPSSRRDAGTGALRAGAGGAAAGRGGGRRPRCWTRGRGRCWACSGPRCTPGAVRTDSRSPCARRRRRRSGVR